MTEEKFSKILDKYGFTADTENAHTGYSSVGKTQDFDIYEGSEKVGTLTWSANFEDKTMSISSCDSDWFERCGKGSEMFNSEEIKFPENNENFEDEYVGAIEKAVEFIAENKNKFKDTTPNYTIDEENEILDHLHDMNGNEYDSDLDDIYESIYKSSKGKLKESEDSEGDKYFDELMSLDPLERNRIIYNSDAKYVLGDDDFFDRIKNGTETKDDVIAFLIACNDYSDSYKDVYGIRPRNEETMCVNGYSGMPDIVAFRNLLKNGKNPLKALDIACEEEDDWEDYYEERDFFNTNPSGDDIKKRNPEYSKYFVDEE